MIFLLIGAVSHAERLALTCNSENLTISLDDDIKFETKPYGWLKGWTNISYVLKLNNQKKEGTYPAQISWRKSDQAGYYAFSLTLMTSEEAQLRQRLEGGSVGFGAIDSRQPINQPFAAVFRYHSDGWPEIDAFQLDGTQLNCLPTLAE